MFPYRNRTVALSYQKSVPLFRSVVCSIVQTCLRQHWRLYSKCSCSESKLELVSVVYLCRQHTRTTANYTISVPYNTYRFSDLSSFLRSSCMSLSVLEGWMGSALHNTHAYSPVQTLRLHVSHGKLRSTCGCLDNEILSVKFFCITLLRIILTRFARRLPGDNPVVIVRNHQALPASHVRYTVSTY